jgi:hypothetical protein
MRLGTRYTPIVDKAISNPVQMFGMGNIVKGSFKESWLAKQDRAKTIEVVFHGRCEQLSADPVNCSVT